MSTLKIFKPSIGKVILLVILLLILPGPKQQCAVVGTTSCELTGFTFFSVPVIFTTAYGFGMYGLFWLVLIPYLIASYLIAVGLTQFYKTFKR
ncbi:MAG TPA: hypothetical protein VJA47_06640 [archaeon]|nr:hypothetical protein [archaeon]